MRRMYSVMLGLLTVVAISSIASVSVKADSTLSALEVQQKNEAGELSDVVLTPAFSPEITEYHATAMSDTVTLEVTASVAEDGAVYDTDWMALDFGEDNKSFIYVTDASGEKTTYTIYTKKLTEEEQETYVPETTGEAEAPDQNATAEVDGVMMKVTGNFTETDIPEGFEQTTFDYNGITVPAIKGTTKDLVAMWLEADPTATPDEAVGEEETTTQASSDDTTTPASGFYIYRTKKGTFYKMQNVYIKSRMYTVIKKNNPDKFLKPYDKATVKIGDTEFESWILDAENQLYLVYAMNWDGETNLYCYDDIEKCFQRYIVASAADTLLQQANKELNNKQDDYNELAEKYNKSTSIKWKTIGALCVVIVILFFVCLNLKLELGKKKTLEGDDDDDYTPTDSKNKKKQEKKNNRNQKKAKTQDFYDDYDDEDEIEEYEEEEDELFKLVDDRKGEPKEDFLIYDKKEETGVKEPVKTQKQDTAPFDIDLGEIDISAQVMKEFEAMENAQPKEKVQPKATTARATAPKANPVITPASQNQEEDDDGFTFI